MQVGVAGWFESDSGAVMFYVEGSSIEAAAQALVAQHGSAAIGVDRGADVDAAGDDSIVVVMNGEHRFWRAFDRIAAEQGVA